MYENDSLTTPTIPVIRALEIIKHAGADVVRAEPEHTNTDEPTPIGQALRATLHDNIQLRKAGHPDDAFAGLVREIESGDETSDLDDTHSFKYFLSPSNNDGTAHLPELVLTVGVTSDDTIYVNARYGAVILGDHDDDAITVYRGSLDNLTPTTAAQAAYDAQLEEVRIMSRHGLTPAEILDYTATVVHNAKPTHWARSRNVSYEAVRKNREQARTILQHERFLTEVIETGDIRPVTFG